MILPEPLTDSWTRLRIRLLTTPFLFLFFLGVLLSFMGIVIFKLPMAIGSLSWPSTEGVVLKSELREIGWSASDITSCPSVSYGYSVNQTAYVSDRLEIQMILCIENTDYFYQDVIQRYPAGKQVEVFYNPRDPALAVLEPGIPRLIPFWPILVITATVIGSILFVFGLLGILGAVKFPN